MDEGRLMYIFNSRYPQEKNCTDFKSGERAGQTISPRNEIKCQRTFPSKFSLVSTIPPMQFVLAIEKETKNNGIIKKQNKMALYVLFKTKHF